MIRYLIFKIQLIGHWWRVRWFMLSNLISPPPKKKPYCFSMLDGWT